MPPVILLTYIFLHVTLGSPVIASHSIPPLFLLVLLISPLRCTVAGDQAPSEAHQSHQTPFLVPAFIISHVANAPELPAHFLPPTKVSRPVLFLPPSNAYGVPSARAGVCKLR